MLTPLTLVTVAALTAGPSIDVIVTRSVGADEDRQLDVAVRQADLLTLQGLAGVVPPATTLDTLTEKGINDATTCAAKRACVARLGKLMGSTVVVSLDLAVVGDRLAFAAEGVVPGDGRRLAYHQALLPAAAYPGGFVSQFEAFAEKLAKAIAADPALKAAFAEKPKDAPVATTLVPKEQPPEVVAPPPEAVDTGGHAAAWAATGTAAAAGTAAIVLTGLGMSAKGTLDGAVYQGPDGPASSLKRADAERLAATSNTELSAALGCAVVSAVAAGVATWLWTD